MKRPDTFGIEANGATQLYRRTLLGAATAFGTTLGFTSSASSDEGDQPSDSNAIRSDIEDEIGEFGPA